MPALPTTPRPPVEHVLRRLPPGHGEVVDVVGEVVGLLVVARGHHVGQVGSHALNLAHEVHPHLAVCGPEVVRQVPAVQEEVVEVALHVLLRRWFVHEEACSTEFVEWSLVQRTAIVATHRTIHATTTTSRRLFHVKLLMISLHPIKSVQFAPHVIEHRGGKGNE